MDDNRMITDEATKTTMVRIRRSDIPKLDKIRMQLREMNNGVRYSRSDAINALIHIANQTEYFMTKTRPTE